MQPYNAYAIGQTILLEGKSTDDEGDPIEPDSPKILLRDPTGEETSLDVSLSDVVGTFFQLSFSRSSETLSNLQNEAAMTRGELAARVPLEFLPVRTSQG